jgi:hypothetical protein
MLEYIWPWRKGANEAQMPVCRRVADLDFHSGHSQYRKESLEGSALPGYLREPPNKQFGRPVRLRPRKKPRRLQSATYWAPAQDMISLQVCSRFGIAG